MRPGMAQTFIGGPFVIRSNPIGALFDQLRQFCSPLPMEESGDGFEAPDGMGTPERESFDSAPADSGWFGSLDFGPPGPISSAPGSSCAPGTVWDAGIGQCVTQPSSAPAVAASTPADARKALATAIAAKDCEGVRQVLDLARSSSTAKRGTPTAKSWANVADGAKRFLASNRKKCNL
jgi:hypothetical protein